jgi:hypothetical protein
MHLPPPGRLFLWAARTWSASHHDLSVVWWSLDRAFTQEGLPAALSPFHRLMSTMFAGLKRWPDIACVACPRLGVVERRLLDAFAHLQQDNEIAARAALREWVLGSAARVMCACARECIQAVSTVGLRFELVPSAATHRTLAGRPRRARVGMDAPLR